MPSEEFILWADKHRPEVMKMRTMLDQPLGDDPWDIREHLVAVEAYNARLNTILADAEQFLIEAEKRELVALGDGGGATSERKVYTKFATKTERKVRDVVKGICRSMEARLMLGMSSMKLLHTEMVANAGVHSSRPRMTGHRTTRPLTPASSVT